MCMYDTSKDKADDKCLTVEKLEYRLAKGDELIKCGPCYGDFNIYPRRKDNICSDKVVPCGTSGRKKDGGDGEMKYPMCIWDGTKPKSECKTQSQLDEFLESRSDNILLDCGFCDELNLFEDYWEPPREITPPPEVEGGSCDWKTMDTCNKGKETNENVNENYFPMCIWDDSKGDVTTKCQKVYKLDNLKPNDYLAGCGYCEDILLQNKRMMKAQAVALLRDPEKGYFLICVFV